ncbi:MAG TPA: CatA-like O-acetyltransferase [bacterium]|nr:CatA-like O-acetyltransferase [bacterium]
MFITCLPWVAFTSFVLPVATRQPDSVPRIAWGKFIESGGKVTLPVAVQVHHAVVDGLHVGQFYARCQGMCNSPELLGA